MPDHQRKLPAIQWYPGDWRKDPGVQALDMHHRGVWRELLDIMHEAEDRGRLTLAGRPMPDEVVVRLLGGGMTVESWRSARATLLAYGVASEDVDGVIYSRRMVRTEEKRRASDAVREARREAGRKGGLKSAEKRMAGQANAQANAKQSPSKPTKQKPSKSPSKRPSKIEAVENSVSDDNDITYGTRPPSNAEANRQAKFNPSSSSSSVSASASTSPSLRSGAADRPGWESDEVGAWSGADVLGAYIAYGRSRGWPNPPGSARPKLGAAGKRLAESNAPRTIVQAMVGMGSLYPHSDGEPWDLMDLERKLTKAQAAAGTDSRVREAAFDAAFLGRAG